MPDQSISLNDFIHSLRYADLPADVERQARRCLLDLLGIWASGSATEPSRIARNHAARRYGGPLDAISMPFDGRSASPPGYAFAGAITIDAVDGHDGHQSCKGHAGAALLPALFAELGTDPDLSMEELLTCLVIGYEVAMRAGLSLHATVTDYHSSGAWNALGCAAMGARLRGLSVKKTRHALGIAEYYGPRAQMMRCIDFPTMVKDSSGWGAMTGISAIDLAEDGFTGAPAILCESDETAEFWSDLGREWRMREMNFKAYPVCRWAQPPIEAALSLLAEHKINPSDITHILVSTFHEATRLAMYRPRDGDEAQYSLPVSAALALLHGTVLPEHLQPDHFNRPDVHALADLVEFTEDDGFNAAFPAERYASVTLTLMDGRMLTSDPAVARGNHDAPLSDKELISKFHAYAGVALPENVRIQLATILTQPADAPAPSEILSLLSANQ